MSQLFDGKVLIQPQAASKFEVAVSQKANPLATGRTIVIGEAEGGDPSQVYWFTNKSDAKDIMRAGDSLRGLGYIFNPSAQEDGAPAVGFVRAQAATQGEYDATAGLFTSIDYGSYVNNIFLMVEAGSQADTSKVSVRFGEELEVFDNLGLAVSIQYVGAGTAATLEITAGNHAIGVVDTVTEFDLDFTLSDYDTVSKVVAAINEYADWDAEIYQYAPSGVGTLDSTVLNTLASGDAKTAAVLLQAYPYVSEHAISGLSAYVTLAAVVDGAKLTNTTDWEPLTGGTAPAMSVSDITTALDLIDEENVQLVWINSESAAHHAMVDQANKDTKYKRFSVHGGTLPTTKALSISEAQSAAVGLNSPYSGYVACGIWDFKEDGSGVELLDPKFFAAKVVGLVAGGVPITPITWKVFSAQGLQYDYSFAERDTLIQAGVIVPNFVDGQGFIITQGVNTLQNNQNLWDGNSDASPEISLMMASWDFNKTVTVNAEERFVGGNVGVGYATIVGFVKEICIQKEADGTLAQNDSDPDNILPAYENIIATRLDAGWSAQVSVRFNGPFNYFTFTNIAVI